LEEFESLSHGEALAVSCFQLAFSHAGVQLADYATARAGTFKLDATKNPREMDSTSDEKEVSPGIYELEPDSYKICFAPAGKPRPTKFSSEPGSGQILQVWERQRKN
jgi:uncharacterized protein (TIGR03067 family)